MEVLCNQNMFHSSIPFSDDATFCSNGTVNRQNCRYWGKEKLYWMMTEAHTQHPKKSKRIGKDSRG